MDKTFQKVFASKKIKNYAKYATVNINEFWAEATTKVVFDKVDTYT